MGESFGIVSRDTLKNSTTRMKNSTVDLALSWFKKKSENCYSAMESKALRCREEKVFVTPIAEQYSMASCGSILTLVLILFPFVLKLIHIHYHTPKQREITFKQRMKLNHNGATWSFVALFFALINNIV